MSDAGTMLARVRRCLAPDQVETFRRDGAVCVRQLLSADEVALLRQGIDANLAAPSPRAKVASRSTTRPTAA
jgi:hypothetical protein